MWRDGGHGTALLRVDCDVDLMVALGFRAWMDETRLGTDRQFHVSITTLIGSTGTYLSRESERL